MAPSLEVLVLQAEHVRQQIEAMRRAAREHGLTFDPSHPTMRRYDDTEALCLACETLWGQVWAGFRAAATAEKGKADAGLTERDRKQAEEASSRG